MKAYRAIWLVVFLIAACGDDSSTGPDVENTDKEEVKDEETSDETLAPAIKNHCELMTECSPGSHGTTEECIAELTELEEASAGVSKACESAVKGYLGCLGAFADCDEYDAYWDSNETPYPCDEFDEQMDAECEELY